MQAYSSMMKLFGKPKSIFAWVVIRSTPLILVYLLHLHLKQDYSI